MVWPSLMCKPQKPPNSTVVVFALMTGTKYYLFGIRQKGQFLCYFSLLMYVRYNIFTRDYLELDLRSTTFTIVSQYIETWYHLVLFLSMHVVCIPLQSMLLELFIIYIYIYMNHICEHHTLCVWGWCSGHKIPHTFSKNKNCHKSL